MPLAAIYARVTTDADEVSIPSQQEICTQQAA
jgi:hypothetical protein